MGRNLVDPYGLRGPEGALELPDCHGQVIDTKLIAVEPRGSPRRTPRSCERGEKRFFPMLRVREDPRVDRSELTLIDSRQTA